MVFCYVKIVKNLIDGIFMYIYKVVENVLKDKVILIIGVGDGIGCVVVLIYVKYGVIVILFGKIINKFECVYDEIVNVGYL